MNIDGLMIYGKTDFLSNMREYVVRWWGCVVDDNLHYLVNLLQWRHNDRDGISNHQRL